MIFVWDLLTAEEEKKEEEKNDDVITETMKIMITMRRRGRRVGVGEAEMQSIDGWVLK